MNEIKNQKKSTITKLIKSNVNFKLCIPIIVGCFSFVILSLLIILLGIRFYALEKARWYQERYYFIDQMDKKRNYTVKQQKEQFQKRAFGIIKENGTTLTVKEIEKYTSLVFDLSQEYDIDPYLSISAAFVESSFNKNKIGDIGERGLYQFRPTTAEEISYKAGIKYYNGIEYNVQHITKLWFEYMDLLLNRFNRHIEYALLAYNCGASNTIKYSNMEINNKMGILNIKSGNLKALKKIIYYNNGYKIAYSDKVLNFKTQMEKKFYGKEN